MPSGGEVKKKAPLAPFLLLPSHYWVQVKLPVAGSPLGVSAVTVTVEDPGVVVDPSEINIDVMPVLLVLPIVNPGELLRVQPPVPTDTENTVPAGSGALLKSLTSTNTEPDPLVRDRASPAWGDTCPSP